MRSVIFIILCLLNKFLFSQDTLRFTNNQIKAVKVLEVGISEIKYLRFDNLTGPTYTVGKYDVQSIKYANGQIDSFDVKAELSVQQNKVPEKLENNNSAQEKILIEGNRLFYKNKPMGEARLGKVILQEPLGQKRNLLVQEYQNMKNYRKRQYTFGFVGLGVGVVAAYVGILGTAFSNDPAPFVSSLAIGVACGVTGAIISGKNKSMRNKKKLEVAKIYNN